MRKNCCGGNKLNCLVLRVECTTQTFGICFHLELERIQVCEEYESVEDSPNVHKVYKRETWENKIKEKGLQ